METACFRPLGASGCNTTRPFLAGGPAAMMARCREKPGVIVVLDEARAQHDVAGATLRCPGCAGQLRRWGFARTRSLRLSGGARAALRPRRVRCAGCAVTHVLLPAAAPVRHAYAIEVVGQALLASVSGQGHRRIGAELGVPADTVRGWVRRVNARAEWLRVQGTTTAHEFDPMLPVVVPAGSALAEAVSVLATAAAATVRRLGPIAPVWQIIAMIAGGQLLTPLRGG